MAGHKRILLIAFMLISLAGLTGWFTNYGVPEGKDYLSEIQKNTYLYGLVYREIAQKYVEWVDPAKLMRVGINAMLDAIDPYTVLIEKEDNAQLQIMTTGKYGGLGMLIGIRDGWPTIVEPPYEDTPAMRAGLREGDHIIEIDGESTKGMSVNEVASRLRGQVGTSVTIKISREGEDRPIEFRLIRAEIVVKDVVYSGLLEDGIGYIKLTRFSKNAGREVKDAIRRLREQGMTALILDLRNNPGGLLEAAVDVADALLPKGKLIVSTRGRVEGTEQSYYSEHEPVLGNLPLAVLVNEASASASEIVSGAIQDLDRGVIIGRRTFGKGLVQSVIGLTRDTRMKLTTAKYYLPSGRLIQKERRNNEPFHLDILYHPDDEGEVEKKQNSAYVTEGGRKVFGGGGIFPDLVVERDTLNQYQQALIRKSMIFNYAVLYANTHENLQRNFEVTEEILNNFREFLQAKQFDYQPVSQVELERFKKALQMDGILAGAQDCLDQLQAKIEAMKQQAFDANLDFIKQQLAMEISAKLWGTAAKLEVSFKNDRGLQKAIDVLKNPKTYYSLLTTDHEIKG
ncbi:MAG: S41 family peptidase [candidate division KSB1 bacterium]|nr:S41 family peptidase [candidate division KSB1 bacterium]MDQ7064532.1 S41 family peptidase [candidate division KSB1 bacterium]